MSLLHPNEDDEAFAQMHADSGFRVALNRVWRLERLLRKFAPALESERICVEGPTYDELQAVLQSTWRNETDDGGWRLDELENLDELYIPIIPGMKVAKCKAPSLVRDASGEPFLCDRDEHRGGLHHCKFATGVITWE